MLTKSRSLVALLTGAAAFAILGYLSEAGGRGAEQGPACCAPGASGAPITLDPALFNGPVREAYKVARHDPALLAQLHCYCGCDHKEGHKNLLDCFRDKHGSRCEICVGEAVQARAMADQGTPVEQIRDSLRQRFAGGIL